METIACDLCGADEPVAFGRDNGYDLVRCGRCGLLYVNPRPTREETEAIYSRWRIGRREVSTGRSQKRDEQAHRWTAARRLERLLRYARPPGRLLEIGCGGGWFLAAAREAGFEVEGVELSPDLAEWAERATGARVTRRSAEEMEFEPGSFDVVCHFNVLSHLRRPKKAFENIGRILKPGGLVFFLTGNRGELAHLDEGRFPGSDWGTPQHLFHFSEATIRLLLEKTGFETLAVHRSPALLDRLTPAYLRTASRRPAGALAKALLWYLPPLRWSLRAAVRLAFPGMLKIQNLQVVARKRSES